MSSRFSFLRRVRIHGGECGAVARALHHKARFTLPAVMETVSVTTYERKQMSIKTSFRRIAFAVVVTLSLGMLGTAPASAGTIIGQTMTVAGSSSSAASTIAQGETATVAVVNTFTPEVALDSLTVMTSCAAPTGATCQDLDFFWSRTTDSVNASVTLDGSFASFTQNDDDSFIIQPTLGGQATRFTSSLKFRASTTAAIGNYTVTVYTKSSLGGAAATVTATSPSITWTVTVTAQAVTVTSLNTYVTTYAGIATANYWQSTFATSKDSAVVAANGKNAITGDVTPAEVAVIRANAKNTLGETTTAAGTNICATACDITATVTNGPGTLGKPSTAATSVKSVVFKVDNDSTTGETDETLVVYSDGTAGVSTISFYNSAGTKIGTSSVTFTGAPASASVSFSDTNVAVSATPKLRAVIKDAAGTAIRTGTVYIYASDTKVVTSGAGSTNAAQYTQVAAGVTGNGVACTDGYDTTLGYWTCNLTIGDTGTAEITLRDSHSVAASTWSSNTITITGHGTAANTVEIDFDKSSYNVGDQATITLTVKDTAGRALGGNTTFTSVTASMGLGTALYTAGGTGGTTLSTTFTNYISAQTGTDSGTETRVVYMPSSSGTLTLSVKFTPPASAGLEVPVTVTKSVTINDPAETAAKAAEAAAAKAGTDAVAAAKAAEDAAVAAAKAAADAAVAAAAAAEKAAKDAVAAAKVAQDAAVAEAQAATDAAAEAIDAANAATDAANLAAEAADAATVAAEEARDAADAATAAVEELATQVASLMAALKAQLTTLANVVAKIAKKIKA